MYFIPRLDMIFCRSLENVIVMDNYIRFYGFNVVFLVQNDRIYFCGKSVLEGLFFRDAVIFRSGGSVEVVNLVFSIGCNIVPRRIRIVFLFFIISVLKNR